MAVTIEEFTAKLGWKTDTTGLKQFQKSMSTLTTNVLKIGGLISGLFTGAMARMVITVNDATAQQYLFAKSIGTTADALEQWQAVLAPIGVDAKYIGNSMLFMNRQMGNIKLGKGGEALKKLKTLGLSAKDLEGMSVAEQYKTVIKSAMGMKDAQVATATLAGLVDRTGMGAAKMLSYLRSTGQTLDDLLGKYEALDINTQAGEESSVRFMQTWRDINFAVDSAKQEFFSLMGEALTPMLNNMLEWIKANKTLIQSRLKYWATSIADVLKSIWKWGSKIVGTFGSLIEKVGGFNNAIKIALIGIGAFKVAPILNQLSLLSSKNFTAGIMDQIKTLKGPLAFGGLAAVIGLAFEDLYTSLTGGDSVGNRLSWYFIAGVERVQNKLIKMIYGVSDAQANQLRKQMDVEFVSIMQKIPDIAARIGQDISDALVNIYVGFMTILSNIPIIGPILVGGKGGRNFRPGGGQYGVTPPASAPNPLNTVLENNPIPNTSKAKAPIVVNNTISISGLSGNPDDAAKVFSRNLETTMNRTLLNASTGGER
jgi:hypothetical protein